MIAHDRERACPRARKQAVRGGSQLRRRAA